MIYCFGVRRQERYLSDLRRLAGDKNMIVFDMEMSGLDSSENGILSLGAVDFDNQDNIFYGECKLREGALVNKQALEINGFTLEQIKNNPKSEKELLKEFLKWVPNIEDKTLSGHNVHFDVE